MDAPGRVLRPEPCGGEQLYLWPRAELHDGTTNHVFRGNIIAYTYIKFKGINHTAVNNLILGFNRAEPKCFYLCQSDMTNRPYIFTNNTCISPKGPAMFTARTAIN